REPFSCMTVTPARVQCPRLEVGARCDADPGPPEVHARGISMPAAKLAERLRPWLNARPMSSDRRWVWDAATIDALDAALQVEAAVPDGVPLVDVEGAYPLWREQPTIYDRDEGESIE